MKNTSLNYILSLLCVTVLAGCGGTNPVKPDPDPGSAQPTVTDAVFIESTEFFNNHSGSVSMRAPLNDRGLLKDGYQFQFRSKDKVAIKNIVIVVGGQRIVLEQGVRYITPSRGLNFVLTLNDSLFMSAESPATLLFNYDGDSKVIEIRDHKFGVFMAGGDA